MPNRTTMTSTEKSSISSSLSQEILRTSEISWTNLSNSFVYHLNFVHIWIFVPLKICLILKFCLPCVHCLELCLHWNFIEYWNFFQIINDQVSCSSTKELPELGLHLKKRYLKCLVIFTSAVLTSFGIYGLWSVQIEFDFLKFLPSESNLALWYRNNLEYFPEEGFRGKIYFAETDIKGWVKIIMLRMCNVYF